MYLKKEKGRMWNKEINKWDSKAYWKIKMRKRKKKKNL